MRLVLAALVVSVVVVMVPQAVTAAPALSVTCNGGGCTGDWYRTNVTVAFHWAPDSTIVSATGCGGGTVSSDTGGQNFACTLRYNNGSTTSLGVSVRRDSTAPSVWGTAERGPDANGWYNHPVHVTFNGTDGGSGVASCTSADYGGPDNASASASGTCTDNAGNQGTGYFRLKYDATPPKLSNLVATTNDKFVALRWTASSDTASVQISRKPGVSGADPSVVFTGGGSKFDDHNVQNGVKYDYSITAVDQAANKVVADISAVPEPALYAPAAGAIVHAPPLLAWHRIKGASYYNLQLFRGRRKILSVWPVRPKYRLARSWTFNGKTFKLTRATYEWRVWPGVGKRKANKYGPLAGHSTFVFR